MSETNTSNIKANDYVVMVKTVPSLTPMKVGDTYKVVEVNNFDVATITNDTSNVTYYISVNTLNEYFQKVEQTNRPAKHIEVEGVEDSTEIQNYVSLHDVEGLLDGGRIIIMTVFDKCTIVAVQLTTGFVIVESSSCVDPENYSSEMGIEQCLNKIISKVYELQAFTLQYDLAVDALINDEKSLMTLYGDELKFRFTTDDGGYDYCTGDCSDCENDEC